MAELDELHRFGSALNSADYPSFCLKPLQIKCLEHILKGHDLVAVLPTGFVKSLLYQLLPNFQPVTASRNIVIVVSPLNSVIEDQLKVLKSRGISADVLQLESDEMSESLFHSDENCSQISSHFLGKSPGIEVVSLSPSPSPSSKS